jgi:hypothetical protein
MCAQVALGTQALWSGICLKRCPETLASLTSVFGEQKWFPTVHDIQIHQAQSGGSGLRFNFIYGWLVASLFRHWKHRDGDAPGKKRGCEPLPAETYRNIMLDAGTHPFSVRD